MPDKRVTVAEIVGELRDGMTIGIGGWGSRRKPMAVVREMLRSDVKDLTVVSYGGPDVGLLCAAGKVKKVVFAFVSLDSIALEPHFRNAKQAGSIDTLELDEGMFLLGLQAAAWRVPFLPTRVGLGSDVVDRQDEIRTVVSPYDDGETFAAMPALTIDVALVHQNRADAGGNAQFLGPDLYFDDLMCQAATKSFVSCERIVATADFANEGSHHTQRISRLWTDGVVETPNGAHFTSCTPDYERDEAFQKEYAASAASAEAWDQWRADWIDLSEADYQSKVAGAMSFTRADICCIAVAECFRGDGEIVANPIGTIPRIGGLLARRSFEPDLVMTDGEAMLTDADGNVEAWNPYRSMFDIVWSGRRHVMMGGSQIDPKGNHNFAAIGDMKRPKAQLLGFRGAPGNTVNNVTSYWVPNHGPRVFVPKVDVVTGVGYDRAEAAGAAATKHHELRHVVTNLCVLDFQTDDHAMRLRSLHPGVTVDKVVAATGFELVVPDDVPTTREPSEDELAIIAELDPRGSRLKEVPEPE